MINFYSLDHLSVIKEYLTHALLESSYGLSESTKPLDVYIGLIMYYVHGPDTTAVCTSFIHDAIDVHG